MDLAVPTYANAGNITSTGRGYIDSVAAFQGRAWAGRVIRANEITGRGLDLAVPAGATQAQQQALQGLVNYGTQNGNRQNCGDTMTKAAAVYRRNGVYFFHADSKTTAGVWIASPPFIRVETTASPADFGKAVMDALGGSQKSACLFSQGFLV